MAVMDVDEVGRTVKGRHEIHMVLDEPGTDDAHADPGTSRREAFVTDKLREPRFSHPWDRRVVVMFGHIAERVFSNSGVLAGEQVSSAIL